MAKSRRPTQEPFPAGLAAGNGLLDRRLFLTQGIALLYFLYVALSLGLVYSPAAFAQTTCADDRTVCRRGMHCECVSPGPEKPLKCTCPPDVGKLPPPLTNLDQAWTQINNIAYHFVVNRDNGHVMVVFFPVGGSSDDWFDLGAPPSGQGDGAVTGPAATSVPGSGFIFLTVANKDHHVCLNQGHEKSWTGWAC